MCFLGWRADHWGQPGLRQQQGQYKTGIALCWEISWGRGHRRAFQTQGGEDIKDVPQIQGSNPMLDKVLLWCCTVQWMTGRSEESAGRCWHSHAFGGRERPVSQHWRGCIPEQAGQGNWAHLQGWHHQAVLWTWGSWADLSVQFGP